MAYSARLQFIGAGKRQRLQSPHITVKNGEKRIHARLLTHLCSAQFLHSSTAQEPLPMGQCCPQWVGSSHIIKTVCTGYSTWAISYSDSSQEILDHIKVITEASHCTNSVTDGC